MREQECEQFPPCPIKWGRSRRPYVNYEAWGGAHCSCCPGGTQCRQSRWQETEFTSCHSHLFLQITKGSAHQNLLFSSGLQQSCPLLHSNALLSHVLFQGASLPSSQGPKALLQSCSSWLPACLPLTLLILSLSSMSSYRQLGYGDRWPASERIEGSSSRTSGDGSLLFLLADRLDDFFSSEQEAGRMELRCMARVKQNSRKLSQKKVDASFVFMRGKVGI